MSVHPLPAKPKQKARRKRLLMPMAPPAYLAALERFVHAFSQIEDALAVVLWIVSEVKQPTAQALLSGVRVDQTFGLLARVMDARKISGPSRVALEETLRQIGLINKIRNEILHFGADGRGQGLLVVSNKRAAHIERRLREITVSARALDDMTYDLDTIWVRLHVYGFRIMASRMADMEFKIPGYAERLRRPWRYTPPPQAPSGGRNPQTLPAQPPQPPSSGG